MLALSKLLLTEASLDNDMTLGMEKHAHWNGHVKEQNASFVSIKWIPTDLHGEAPRKNAVQQTGTVIHDGTAGWDCIKEENHSTNMKGG